MATDAKTYPEFKGFSFKIAKNIPILGSYNGHYGYGYAYKFELKDLNTEYSPDNISTEFGKDIVERNKKFIKNWIEKEFKRDDRKKSNFGIIEYDEGDTYIIKYAYGIISCTKDNCGCRQFESKEIDKYGLTSPNLEDKNTMW